MFERVIYNILHDVIEDVTPSADEVNPDVRFLRRLLYSPGWQDGAAGGNDEIQKIVNAWISGDGKPCVRVNYPRDAADLPCFAIVLGSESEGPEEYLNHDAGLYAQAAIDLVSEIESEIGRPVTAHVKRFTLNYSIYVYTSHPDVTLAYYTFLRNVIMSNEGRALLDCLEDPKLSGQDLMPSPQHLPANVYTRQLNIQGFAHVLFSEELLLGPLGVARGTSVARIHVNDNVTGVNPGVNPYVEDADGE